MASTKERPAAGSELRDVFAGAREDPTLGLAGAVIGATDVAGAVTGLGERGVAAARAGGADIASRIGPAAEAVQSSVATLRDNPPDWDQVRSQVKETVGKSVSGTLAETAETLRTTADTARTTARDLATGPVGQAVRERAAELAATSKELAQEKGAVARKAAEQKSREAAKKLNQSVNKSSAAATVAKVRKDLEPRLAELGDLAGDVSQRAAEIATAASAAALAKLHEKERKQRSRRRRRRLIVLLLGAVAGAAAAAQLRRKSDAGSAATAYGASGSGTAAGAPVDTVPDAAATQETTTGAADLPPATSADANGDLKS
jgi:hypothetical protein